MIGLPLVATPVVAKDATVTRDRTAKSPPKNAGHETPPAPATAAPVALPDPPLPVAEARNIGLGECVPILDQMSRQLLTSQYSAQPEWSQTDPTHHVFQTVTAVDRPGNTPPDGVVAFIAAPVTAGGCDGVAVQVFPLAADCQTAQKMILNGGKTLGSLMSARMMLDSGGNRLLLLPGFSNTCIAIALDSRFGAATR